jgi:hypothetical protein
MNICFTDAHQVFELLETVYGALDKIAKKRRIFKVETVGYVNPFCLRTCDVFHFDASSTLVSFCISQRLLRCHMWCPHAKGRPCSCNGQVCNGVFDENELPYEGTRS